MEKMWNCWIDRCAGLLGDAHYGPFLNTFLSGLAVGLLLALLSLLLVLVIERRRRRSGILSHGESGSMFITPEAVRQFVERTLDEVGEVKLRAMEMRQLGNGNCEMSLSVKLAPDCDVRQLVDEARRHVIKQAGAKLGVQGALKVNVAVRGFDRALVVAPGSRQREAEDLTRRNAMTGYPTLSE